MTEPVAVPGYEVVKGAPLVVLAEVGVDGLGALASRLVADFPDRRFIGILAADEGDDVAAVLTRLDGVLAEVIFTASSSPEAIAGLDLATRALENCVLGQDFVFTMSALADALTYGVDVLTRDADRWDGSALLVLGSAAAIDEARLSL